MKDQTLKERVTRLEAIVEERTKTLFVKVDEILKVLKECNNQTQEQIKLLSNHLSTLTKRVEALERGHLTRAEKIKMYGSIASALIAAIAAIVVALLK